MSSCSNHSADKLSCPRSNPTITSPRPRTRDPAKGGSIGFRWGRVVARRGARSARAPVGAGFLVIGDGAACRRDHARSKRSRFITLLHAATKSRTSFSSAPSQA